LIAGRASRNRAVHGDVVIVQLLPKSEWRARLSRLAEQRRRREQEDDDEPEWEAGADVCPTGRVVGVLDRGWREYVATVPKEEAEAEGRKSARRVLVVPYDRRIPKIRILTSQVKKLSCERFAVAIDNWPVGSQYPNGHFVRTLGPSGNLETEIDGILLENDIRVQPFSQGILREMPNGESWKPSEEEVKRRRDLRESHSVMSVDPPGCEDVDDCLSVRQLPGGNVELGVHIADVTHFVEAGSLTDREAQKRATTVYLADRRYDMLPSVLSSNLCSLLGGKERYAVSVLWELDAKKYEVLNVWYGRTVIKSRYKLAYATAQKIIDGELDDDEQAREAIPELAEAGRGQGLRKKIKILRDDLRLLSEVSRRIQEKREAGGALRLEGSEVRFEFDPSSGDSGLPAGLAPKEHLAVHETVAECMIFANEWVAKRIAETYPHRSLLRRHPPPRKEAFEELKRCAAAKGWSVDTRSNAALAASLDRCKDAKDPSVNFLLRSLATYAMVQAAYFSTGSVPQADWNHYGLALTRYTHFTSPIRRYADMVVHRLLLAAVRERDWWGGDDKHGQEEERLPQDVQLQEMCSHVNERNRAAQNAQRASQSLFQALFFKGREPDDPRCVADAVVFSIRPNGFLVYVPKYALKGACYVQRDSQDEGRQVLVVKKNFGPVWTGGRAKADGNTLTVEPASGGGKRMYRLFEHLTVVIQMEGSDAHAPRLAYYLLRDRAFADSGSSNKGEVDFLRELRKEEGGEREETDNSDGEESSDLERKPSTMMEFFKKMRLMGESEGTSINTQK